VRPGVRLAEFYHACCFPVGLTCSAAAAKTLTEWITEGEPEWDMSMWDPRRFGEEWASFDFTVKRSSELYEHQYAIPYPHRLWKSGRPEQTTLLYDTLKAKGAVFGQVAGWERAFWFEKDRVKDDGKLSFHHEAWHVAVKAEREGVRDNVGVMDHGGFTRYEVEGLGATEFLNHVFCGAMPGVGRVKLSYMLTPKGKVWSEATIARLEENKYLLCGPALADQRDHDWMMQFLPEEGVSLKRGSEFDAALMVMGPKSRGALQLLTSGDLSKEAAPRMSVREITLSGAPVIALRMDFLFDEALARGIPVVAVGDGGNEIGMGKVADQVRAHVPYGDTCQCGCGGNGAVTGCDVLVTAAYSNWGCTAIAAAMAARAGNAKLLHTPGREALLLDTMVANGLINSTHGIVDDSIDGFPRHSHLAVAELCRTVVSRAL